MTPHAGFTVPYTCDDGWMVGSAVVGTEWGAHTKSIRLGSQRHVSRFRNSHRLALVTSVQWAPPALASVAADPWFGARAFPVSW